MPHAVVALLAPSVRRYGVVFVLKRVFETKIDFEFRFV